MIESSNNLIAAEVGDPSAFVLALMKERTPEKAGTLQSVVIRHHISFQFDETVQRVFYRSNAQTGEVRIGLTCSTRLMAHTFAYLSANFAGAAKAKNAELGLPIPSEYLERLRAASELLAWALTQDVKCKLLPHSRNLIPDYLPDDLVQLLERCLEPRHHDAAAELFANALVWILYHEIAHIQAGDEYREGLESIDQEKRADRKATDWMLDSQGIETADRRKRQLGIAIALGWLTAPSVCLGPGTMTTHPHAHDRLFQTIDSMVEPEEEDVWMFVQMILVLHLHLQEVPVDEARMAPSYKENCNYLIDIISKLPKAVA